MTKRHVAMMQDGAIDELISVVFLTTMPDLDLFYVDVLNADCLAQPTCVTTQKLLRMVGREDDFVFPSAARGTPFPGRTDSMR